MPYFAMRSLTEEVAFFLFQKLITSVDDPSL